MKHHQFETWILQETGLDQEQQRDLQSHLKGCLKCQALYKATQQIAHLFRTSPVPELPPDFSTRWISRMETIEKRKNRLIIGVTLSVISVATIVLLSSVGIQIQSSLAAFPQMLLEMVTLLTNWIVFLNQIWNIFTPLFRVSIKLVSPIWLYSIGFSLIGVTVAWMVSLAKSRTLQKELQP
jgi:hypothetical protein